MAVLFISSELDEVLRCADRVAVLRDRVKVGELDAERIDEQTIMRTIAQTGPAGGGDPDEPPPRPDGRRRRWPGRCSRWR